MSLIPFLQIGASLLGGLLSGRGRRSSQETNTESVTNQQATSTTSSQTASSTGHSSSTVFDIKMMTPEGFEALSRAMRITENLANDALKYYNREQALKEAELAMTQLFREYRETELPKIFIQQANAGLYNTTTGQLLANDAYARVVDLANARRLEFIKTFNSMLNDNINLFLRALDVHKGSVKQGGESTSGGSSTVSTTTSTTQNVGTSVTQSRQTGSSRTSGTGFDIPTAVNIFNMLSKP